MKRLFCLLAFALPCSGLLAQNAANPANPIASALSFLTVDQRTELLAAFQKATTDNPALKTETVDLLQQATAMPMNNMSITDLAAFRAKVLIYEEQLRGAMIKEDAAVAPLLDQVDAHLPELHPELVGQ